MQKEWQVYLSGEIHTNWRHEMRQLCEEFSLPVSMSGPQDNHELSDDCGIKIIAPQPDNFWKDRMSSGINSIRTQTLIQSADVVIIRFGDKYKQWNAAFDAGFAAAMKKPYIVIQPEDFDHALKEVNQGAAAVVRTVEQAAKILRYVTTGEID